MTDDKIKGLDQCATAVQRALAECSKEGAIDFSLSDPNYALAVEAQCFVQAWRRLRGKPEGKAYYA